MSLFTLPRPNNANMLTGTEADVLSHLRGLTPVFRRSTPVQGRRGSSVAVAIPHNPEAFQWNGADFAVVATYFSYGTPDTLPHACLSPKDNAKLVALRLSGVIETH